MRSFVKTLLKLNVILTMFLAVATAHAQQPKPVTGTPASASTAPSQTQKNIEAYLRNLYAFAPELKLIVAPLQEPPVEEGFAPDIDRTVGENKDQAKFEMST